MGGIRIPMVCKLLTFSRASFCCIKKSYLLAQPTYDRAFGAASSLLRGALGRFALISLSRAGANKQTLRWLLPAMDFAACLSVCLCRLQLLFVVHIYIYEILGVGVMRYYIPFSTIRLDVAVLGTRT